MLPSLDNIVFEAFDVHFHHPNINQGGFLGAAGGKVIYAYNLHLPFIGQLSVGMLWHVAVTGDNPVPTVVKWCRVFFAECRFRAQTLGEQSNTFLQWIVEAQICPYDGLVLWQRFESDDREACCLDNCGVDPNVFTNVKECNVFLFQLLLLYNLRHGVDDVLGDVWFPGVNSLDGVAYDVVCIVDDEIHRMAFRIHECRVA